MATGPDNKTGPIDPEAEAAVRNAMARQKDGLPDLALADYGRALAIQPGYPAALIGRGVLRAAAGNLRAAIEDYDAALRHGPPDPYVYYVRGNARRRARDFEAAAEDYGCSIRLDPGRPEVHYNLGLALSAMGRIDAAVAAYDDAIRLRPRYHDVFNSRGLAQVWGLRFEHAVEDFDRAISLNADFAEAHCKRGMALVELARFDDAIAAFDRALAIAPALDAPARAKTAALLLMGDFAGAWALESSWRDSGAQTATVRRAAHAALLADDAAPRSVLITARGGLGDTIQFCRYAALLARRGHQVVLSPQPALSRLLLGLTPEPGLKIAAPDDPAVEAEFRFNCLELPSLFLTTLPTIPGATPYLRAEPDRVALWRERIGEDGFRIGVSWQGSLGRFDIGRSFPASHFAGLSRLPGVRLLSLQKGQGRSQLADLPAGLRIEDLGAGFDAGPDAFIDTAAVMQACDLVITSDTAVAHLAGALGVPAWVALKRIPEWRWLLGRDDSPWYPSLRLFRQNRRGDWAGVFAEIVAALEGRLADGA